MPGKISTHVLDLASGKPASGVKVELWRVDAGAEPERLHATETNADGRTDAPLLAGEGFRTGRYELRFRVGDYFARSGCATPEPPFLDEVPVRFAVADPDAGYHVPLLVSPWAYSTYRGS